MNKQREALELARAATPHDQLITELLDSRIPKTEREHAAAREIKKLREALDEPARKPLRDSEVFNLAADYYEGYGFKAAEFARAIERAHGIGEA